MSTSSSFYRNTGILLIVEGLLMFLPVAILGAAINWPVSLGDPANVMLPRLVDNSLAVTIGYSIYLIYSVLFFPVALLTSQIVTGKQVNRIWFYLGTGLGIASTIGRTLGIIRWLVAMPALAKVYVDPATSDATKEAIAVVYKALNDYGGSIGEVLGVSLFTALWLITVAIAIRQARILPNWIGWFALVAASLLLVQLVELFGVDLGAYISVSVSMLQIWFLATGIVIWRRARTLTQRQMVAVEASSLQ
ncbi:DUF4386 family protein [Merismopedia glauca]|nr:DUF4386 family protein [Merismopedia glauca]